MEDQLKIKIIGDVDSLKKSMSEAQASFDALSKEAASLKKDIADNISITQGYKNAQDQLNKEFKEGLIDQKAYSAGLNRLKRDEKETEIETKRLRAELSNVNKAQKDLAAVTPKLGTSMVNQGKATSNATGTLMEFSRVMQDAPYGIQGVGNNITQLVTNFGYLTKSAGGAGAAFKVLLSSFTGPAGIIFAVSTIVTLFTVYGKELFSAVGATNKLTEATKEYLGEAKAEVIGLETLLAISKDETQSKQVRLGALERLNDKYGDYLGNLTLENIGTKEVKASVDQLTMSLIKQAQVRGANKLIEEETADLAEKSLKLMDEENKARDLAVQGLKDLKNSNATFREFAKEGDSMEETFNNIAKLAKGTNASSLQLARGYIEAFRTAEKATKDFEKEATASIAPLQRILQSLTAESIGLDVKQDEGVVVTVKMQEDRDKNAQKIADDNKKIFDKIAKEISLIDPDQAQIDAYEIEKIYEESGAKIKAALRSDDPDIFGEGVELAYFKLLEFEKKLADIKAKFGDEAYNIAVNMPTAQIDDFVAKLEASKIIADASTRAITTVFDNMGAALVKNADESGSALDRFTASLAQSVLQIMATYLSQSIAAAIAGGSSSGAATGPGAIVAMPTMIATLTAAVIGAFAAIPKFAQGGIFKGGSAFNGDNLLARLNPDEMVLTNRQQANLFDMLNGSLRRQASQGSEAVEVVGTISGSDILLSNRRAERKNKRYNG